MKSKIVLLCIPDAHVNRLQEALQQANFEPVVAHDVTDLASSVQDDCHAIIADLDDPESPAHTQVEFVREVKGINAPLVLFTQLEEEKDRKQKALAFQAAGIFCPSSPVSALVQILGEVGYKTLPVKKRIMVVDDSEITGIIIEAELKDKFEVTLVENVTQAARLILKKETRPDLVLLDVRMPNVDGVHFCRFLKSNSMFQGIKVVLCSGLEISQLQAAAEECCADGFVAKDQLLSKWVIRQMNSDPEEQEY